MAGTGRRLKHLNFIIAEDERNLIDFDRLVDLDRTFDLVETFDHRTKLEETTVQLQETAEELEAEKDKTERLLTSIIPPKVVSQLKAGQKVHEDFKQVTSASILLSSPFIHFHPLRRFDCILIYPF